MSAAIFLDKDGTLIEDVPYNVDPALMRLTPYAREACEAFYRAGFHLVVVTNQSGIAKGLFKPEALQGVCDRLQDMLGVPLAGFYHCPHDAADDCECRKPLPGMLRQAADDLGLDLSQSWMIGDILNDVEAGRRAGCRTILIDNGGETQWVGGALRKPDHIVEDVGAAALAILCGEARAA